MRNLVILCAGESSRFPGEKPKWALTHPSGNIMGAEAARGVLAQGEPTRVVVALNEAHYRRFTPEAVSREFSQGLGLPEVEVVCVGTTGSQAETARVVVTSLGLQGPSVFRDCDSHVSAVTPEGEGFVVGCGVAESHTAIAGKGLLRVSESRCALAGELCFSVGVYGFEDAREVLSVERSLIDAAVGKRFVRAEEYEDWGDAAAWGAFRARFATLFVDVDGVVFTAAHRSFPPAWGQGSALPRNVETLLRLERSGRCRLVFTTARSGSYRAETISQLQALGFRCDELVCGLPATNRILINDYASGGPTATAVNVKRDADDLACLLPHSLT